MSERERERERKGEISLIGGTKTKIKLWNKFFIEILKLIRRINIPNIFISKNIEGKEGNETYSLKRKQNIGLCHSKKEKEKRFVPKVLAFVAHGNIIIHLKMLTAEKDYFIGIWRVAMAPQKKKTASTSVCMDYASCALQKKFTIEKTHD